MGSTDPKPELKLHVCVPSAAVFSWESQATQYVVEGKHEGPANDIVFWEAPADFAVIWCVLHYDRWGQLDGILNFYPNDIPGYEKAGNFNIWTRPDRKRKGVGLALLSAADERFVLDFEQQRYTPAGAKLAQAYLAKVRS